MSIHLLQSGRLAQPGGDGPFQALALKVPVLLSIVIVLSLKVPVLLSIGIVLSGCVKAEARPTHKTHTTPAAQHTF